MNRMRTKMSSLGVPNRGGFVAQAHNRRMNDRAVIENPLAHFTDEELEEDVLEFQENFLPSANFDTLLRAARVAKDIQLYDKAARADENDPASKELPVQLTPEEKWALRRERDVPFSEKGMRVVVLTVSLAAILQGFVQSSFNGAALYKDEWGLEGAPVVSANKSQEWQLGAANASPWLFAALIGCPLSLPINYWYGRRGALTVASSLILISSIAAIFADDWKKMLGIRVINGLGMGIKAVSTPILASETAVGFWRGSAILAWQLWVAFGIMLGFVFNLIFAQSPSNHTTFRLIQGAPIVPAAVLLVTVTFLCPESPRYHLTKGPNYSVERAYAILRTLRNTELQAMRDMYAVHKSIEQESMGAMINPNAMKSPGFWWTLRDFMRLYNQLFTQRRLINALISSSTVNLAQQLCGVNVFAFYSGTLFKTAGVGRDTAMAYSLGFGAINFVFALPAIKSIDTIGRRKWLLMTLPFMSLFMFGAGLAFLIPEGNTRTGVVAFFLFMFAIAYSPGLGPIPFTLAAESFPLYHREAGTAIPISINLLFAGLLSIFYPKISEALTDLGSLCFFGGLNIVALVLIFLFVEETKGRSLEDLDLVFAVSKRRFISFQIREYLPWFFRRVMGKKGRRPELYNDLIWGSMTTKEHHFPAIGEDDSEEDVQTQHFEVPIELPADDAPPPRLPDEDRYP